LHAATRRRQSDCRRYRIRADGFGLRNHPHLRLLEKRMLAISFPPTLASRSASSPWMSPSSPQWCARGASRVASYAKSMREVLCQIVVLVKPQFEAAGKLVGKAESCGRIAQQGSSRVEASLLELGCQARRMDHLQSSVAKAIAISADAEFPPPASADSVQSLIRYIRSPMPEQTLQTCPPPLNS